LRRALYVDDLDFRWARLWRVVSETEACLGADATEVSPGNAFEIRRISGLRWVSKCPGGAKPGVPGCLVPSHLLPGPISKVATAAAANW